MKYEFKGDEEYIVIGCDGIWDVLSNEDMYNKLKYYQREKS